MMSEPIAFMSAIANDVPTPDSLSIKCGVKLIKPSFFLPSNQ